MPEQPEPWLRGPVADVHPLISPVFFSFAQVREDLAQHTAGLTVEQTWRTFGKSSLGFHLRHLAGSVDRLVTYLMGGSLDEKQLRFLGEEHTPGADISTLLAAVNDSLTAAEERLNQLDPGSIYARREVGRNRLPTTVIGLVVHLAEHTQRHLGQAITITQLLRHWESPSQ